MTTQSIVQFCKVSRFCALALLIPLCLSACNHDAAGEDKSKDSTKTEVAAVPVEVATVARRTIDASYTGTATLTADSEAQVVAKTRGVLLKLYVEEGDLVKPGQLLAKLDDANTRLNVVKAEAVLHKLENDYRRSDELFAKKLVSRADYDKIRYDLETERAAHELAKLELSYTNIVAPIGGVVSQRMVKAGNLIQEQQALFKIDNFDPLLAVLNVPEREFNTLKPDLPVVMSVDALPGKSFGGRVQRISPVVDAATGTLRVTCEFRDETKQLKPGMFGRLSINYNHHENVLTVPRASLIEEDGEQSVYAVVPGSEVVAATSEEKKSSPSVPADKDKVKKDEKPKPVPAWAAQRRQVKVGYSDNTYVEIVEGLKEDDRVITIGRNAVRDGTAVQVLEALQ